MYTANSLERAVARCGVIGVANVPNIRETVQHVKDYNAT
jgi:hypothetical protein